MTELSALVCRAREIGLTYPGCTHEQALVYACEDVVEREVGSRTIRSHDVGSWIEDICEREDMDTPVIMISRLSRATLASSNDEEQSICLRGKTVTVGTVLHELAHLSSGSGSHGVLWRDEFTRLTRAHVSVSYAALLHSLYIGTGLGMSPWPASASRR